MNATVMLVLHWVLNIVLMCACLACVYFGFFGSGANITVFDRVMTEVVGAAFGVLAFFFTRYTLAKG